MNTPIIQEFTQKEHMMIANECKQIFLQQFPTIGEALGWDKQNV